jgi:hypothetical protein
MTPSAPWETVTFASLRHPCDKAGRMSTDSARLMVHCQMALKLSQKELGAIVGKDRRTIQRWQDKGCTALLPQEAEALASALRPTHPDLADQVLALGGRTAVSIGQAVQSIPVTPLVIDAILAAATRAAQTSPGAIEAVVEAAFDEAARAGVQPAPVAAAIRTRRSG